jgi:hypothetical protein
MQYLVSFALLVAVGGWMVAVYNRLYHLRCSVCTCWYEWRKATHYRNECLSNFTTLFALFLPQDDALARHLRHLVVDSEKSLSLSLEPRWNSRHGFVSGAERLVRQAVVQSVHVVEQHPMMRGHEHLHQLCCNVSLSLEKQAHVSELFNAAAAEYNAALNSFSARVLAPVFGFAVADTLDVPTQKTCNP